MAKLLNDNSLVLSLSKDTSIRNYAGFSFLEIMIVVAVIAITISVVVPKLDMFKKNSIDNFKQEFNNLLAKSRLNGLETGKMQKILIDIKNRTINLQQESTADKATGELLFSNVKSSKFKTEFEFNSNLEFHNFYVKTNTGTRDEFKKDSTSVWFFVTPDGISQEIIINVTDSDNNSRAGLVLNPFTLLFEQHEDFQKL